MSLTLDQSFTTYSTDKPVYNTQWCGEYFTCGLTGPFTQADVYIYKYAGTSVDLIVCLYTDSSGHPGTLLDSVTISATNIGTSYGWVSAYFAGNVTINSGTKYHLVLHCTASTINTGYEWGHANTYIGASQGDEDSANQGGSWTDRGYNCDFKTYINIANVKSIASSAKIKVTQYKVPEFKTFEYQKPVETMTLTAAPGSPVKGKRYIVKATASGVWTGLENNIVEYDGVDWEVVFKRIGLTTYVKDVNLIYVYNGSAWVQFGLQIPTIVTATAVLDATRYVSITINGVAYKLALIQ